jgi:hypothetical protein
MLNARPRATITGEHDIQKARRGFRPGFNIIVQIALSRMSRVTSQMIFEIALPSAISKND